MVTSNRGLLVTAAAGLAAAAALGSHLAVDRRAVHLDDGVARLNAELSAIRIDSRGDQPLRQDFIRRLPRVLLAAPLLDEFRRAAAEGGVALSSVSIDAREPTERTLGRLQIAAVLRGSYPAVKAAVAEVAARFPNLVFQRVSVRRLATPTDVEARVDVVLSSPPERRAGDSPPLT